MCKETEYLKFRISEVEKMLDAMNNEEIDQYRESVESSLSWIEEELILDLSPEMRDELEHDKQTLLEEHPDFGLPFLYDLLEDIEN